MSSEIRIPDIEIIVGCAGDDVACFAFHLLPDVHQGYDVTVALTDPHSRAVVRQILQDAITAINNADWFTLDGLHQDEVSETADPPF